MNRTFFFSIAGLAVLPVALVTGSPGQSCTVTSAGSSQCAPVVLVTQPDGNRVVAQCVSVSACDPKAKGKGECRAYTFTTQGGLVAGGVTAQGLTGCDPVNGLVTTRTLTLGSGNALLSTSPSPEGESKSPSSNLLRIMESNSLAAVGGTDHDVDPVVIALDGDENAHWHEDLEQALEAARDQLSEQQDGVREAWERATEEARAAQEHAREAYDEAMETYREAMQTAQARSRDRQHAERRAQAESGARGSLNRSSPRAKGDAEADRDAHLESRIAALEEAARARGQSVDKKRSLEERVAQLEHLNAQGHSPLSGLLKSRRELDAQSPKTKVFRVPSAPRAPDAPAQPTPRKAPKAAAPDTWFGGTAPFMKLREGVPGVPAAPGQPSVSDDERKQMGRAMEDLKREAARLREELQRMRAEVERLPRANGAR